MRSQQAFRTETLSASRLGQDFEHGAVVMSTTLIRYAVKMTSFIGKEGAVGSVSVPTVVVEDMQLLLGPASPSLVRELEHGAIVIPSALASGSVEIARSIHNQAAIRIASVPVARLEGMHDGLGPFPTCLRGQLKDHARVVGAAEDRGAIEWSKLDW
jgi:hypothetical protein